MSDLWYCAKCDYVYKFVDSVHADCFRCGIPLQTYQFDEKILLDVEDKGAPKCSCGHHHSKK